MAQALGSAVGRKAQKQKGRRLSRAPPASVPEVVPLVPAGSEEAFDWSVFDAEILALGRQKPAAPTEERPAVKKRKRPKEEAPGTRQAPARQPLTEGDASVTEPEGHRRRMKNKAARKLAIDLEHVNKPAATGRAAEIARRFQHSPSIVTDGTGRQQRTVFVGNIPPLLATPGPIRSVFEGCGVLIEVRPIQRDGAGFTGPKMAYCEFDSVVSAQQAIQRNGYILGGNALRINMAHDKTQRLQALQRKGRLKASDLSKVNCRLLNASQKRLRLDSLEAGRSGRLRDIIEEVAAP